jgi:hypothetical protein
MLMHTCWRSFWPRGRPAAPRASDLTGGVAKLFDLSAKNTPPAIAAARAQYEQLKRVAPNDSRIDYAYALVLLNQHKYRDALPLVSRYLETGNRDLDADCIKMWAEIQERRYGDVLDAASALSQRIAKTGKSTDDALDAARFLGTVFGYLELARPGVVNAELRMKRKNQVLARLGESHMPAFDEGRDAVAELLTDLQAARATELKQTAAAVERRQTEAKGALDKGKSSIAAHQETMQSSAEQVRDAQREMNVLQTQLASLQNDRTRLAAQIITVQTQLTQLLTPQATTIDLTRPGDPNPVRADVTQSISFDRTVQATVLATTLAGLNKQAFNMDRQILALRARGAAVSGKGQQETERLAEEDEAARKAEKRVKTLEKQLGRTKAPATPRITAPTGAMAMLSTYAPLPFDKEKTRVLSWFAK